MKLNFNLYILLIIVCIGMVFPYSNKQNFHYQALLHFTTGIFLYLMIATTNHDHEHTPVQNNHPTSKELTEAELTCLKDKACNLSASKDECNTYSRCKWDNTNEKCNVRTPCEDLDVYDCVKSDYCDFNVDGKGACTYKTVEGKIFNEDAKANRYCFKKNPEYIEDDPKGEYVEDSDYVNCEKDCEKKINKLEQTECLENCKKDAINRLSCNTVEGMKFQTGFYTTKNIKKYKTGICMKKSNYIPHIKNTKTVPRCMKVAQHSHNNPNEDGYIPHTPGYRTPHTFKINDDRKLRFLFNIFIIFFIILINIGIIKLFKN